jgi:hypothetical protein
MGFILLIRTKIRRFYILELVTASKSVENLAEYWDWTLLGVVPTPSFFCKELDVMFSISYRI